MFLNALSLQDLNSHVSSQFPFLFNVWTAMFVLEKDNRVVPHCLIPDFEFRVVLLEWLPTKAKELSLSGWRRDKFMPYLKAFLPKSVQWTRTEFNSPILLSAPIIFMPHTHTKLYIMFTILLFVPFLFTISFWISYIFIATDVYLLLTWCQKYISLLVNTEV